MAEPFEGESEVDRALIVLQQAVLRTLSVQAKVAAARSRLKEAFDAVISAEYALSDAQEAEGHARFGVEEALAGGPLKKADDGFITMRQVRECLAGEGR